MMANLDASTLIASLESSGKKAAHLAHSNINMFQPSSSHHSRSSSDGPIAILWDIENCPVPSDVRPEDVAGNIRMALWVHPVINGAVMMFSAYGDFNAFPKRLREGCQRTGVKLIDIPNGRKDAADKAILVDMFLFALDNPPPSSIMLVSGDVDFAPALHILGQRGYTVILVIPTSVGVSSALTNAGKFVWDWPSVVRGEGFVPPTKVLTPPHGVVADTTAYLMGCHVNVNPDAQNDEEAIIDRGISQSYCNLRDLSILSQSLSACSNISSMLPHLPTTLRSQSLPSGLNEASGRGVSSGDQMESTLWVQPGDLNGLKGQLVKLLELSGGCLPLTRVPAEYNKYFGRPLYVSEYGALKLVGLFRKMGDAMAVEGKGQRKFVYLRKSGRPSASPLVLAKKDKKEKGTTQEECMDNVIGGGSLDDDLSDEERVVIEENDVSKSQFYNQGTAACFDSLEQQFKYELQEILVSYACPIFLGSFEAIYQQRYKKPLEYKKLGVNQLEELLEKVRDVVELHEEPINKRKFLAAVGG